MPRSLPPPMRSPETVASVWATVSERLKRKHAPVLARRLSSWMSRASSASSVRTSSGIVGAGVLGAGVSVEGNSEERQEDWSPLILERMWLFRCVFSFLFVGVG